MHTLNHQEILESLQQIVEFELAGAIRYTHYSLIAIATPKKSIVDFLREQATESLEHAQKVGELFIDLGGISQPRIASLEEIADCSIDAILTASLKHEKTAISMYKYLFDSIDPSVAEYQQLRQFSYNMFLEESEHCQEMQTRLATYKTPDRESTS